MHCNFSTDYMRDTGGKDYFLKLMDKFEEYKDEHKNSHVQGGTKGNDSEEEEDDHGHGHGGQKV